MIEDKEEAMNERLDKYEEKMMKTLDNLEQEFAGIRAGRANPHILDKITVDYYGTQTPLQQVGNISVPDPKCIVISPWENKMIKEIEVRSMLPISASIQRMMEKISVWYSRI